MVEFGEKFHEEHKSDGNFEIEVTRLVLLNPVLLESKIKMDSKCEESD